MYFNVFKNQKVWTSASKQEFRWFLSIFMVIQVTTYKTLNLLLIFFLSFEIWNIYRTFQWLWSKKEASCLLLRNYLTTFFRFGLACFTSLTYRINLCPDTIIALFRTKNCSTKNNLSNICNFHILSSNLLTISHYFLS